MIFSWQIAWRFSLGMGVALLAIWLLASTHLFATSLLLALTTALLAVDLIQRVVRRTAVSTSRPLRAPRLSLQDPQCLQTMLDTVSAVLIVMREDHLITLANLAAHRLAGGHVNRLQQIDSIGAAAATRIEALAPGSRQIIRMGEGHDALVSVSEFAGTSGELSRLISIQRVAGELDLVEVKAWRDMMRVLMHEMMNSLTPIASLAESLARAENPAWTRAEARSALEAIHRRSLGLIAFADNYRRIAELPRPVLQSVQAHAFASGIGHLLQTSAEQAGISFTVRLNPQSSRLAFQADPQLLEQAVINLVRNAFDAASAVTARIVDVGIDEQDGRIRIVIADSGRGVDSEIREQLGVPFFTTKQGGSGVGLSLARHIALAHGGGVDFKPREPQGSIFTLWLPVVAAR